MPPHGRPSPARRLTDAATGLGAAAGEGLRGSWRGLLGAVRGGIDGADLLLSGRPGPSIGRLLRSGLRLVQIPVDAAILLGARCLSAVQTVCGLEAPARSLTADEVTLLRPFFGDGLDYEAIRVKEGDLGILRFSGRACVIGGTVFLPGAPGRLSATRRRELLIHEAVHLWQHRHGGIRYLSEALWAQTFGEGYNFAIALAQGRGFQAMNPEQQAQLIEAAAAAGWDPRADRRRFLVRLEDPRRNLGYRVLPLAPDHPDGPRAMAAGFRDVTATLRDALRDLRDGRSLP